MKTCLAILAILLALAGCRRAGGDATGFIVMPGMVQSVPYDPFDPSPVMKNGQTLQMSVDGTVAYGAEPSPFGAGAPEAERAGKALKSPLPDTAETVARGKVVFETFCFVCHGPGGAGDGPVTGAKRMPIPPSLLGPRARTILDGQIFHIVTFGQGAMPSYAAQIRPQDRWAAVRYVRDLQKAAPAAGGAP